MLKVLRNSWTILLFLIVGCGTTIDNEKDLLQWLGDTDNGFVKKTSANGFSLSMKYLPATYLALNELKKDDRDDLESLDGYIETFKNSRTFLFTITHEDQRVDATNYGVTNMGDYNQRIQDLSFNIKDIIQLKTSSGKAYKPVLTTMENLYEIGNKKVIYLVFSDDDKEILKSEKLDIVFQDAFLDTGISHFVFDSKKIDNLPNLNFLKSENL